MALPKFVAVFVAFAVVATTLQPSEARVQGFKPAAPNQEASDPAIAANHEVSAPSSKAAAGDGGLPPLPHIPGFSPGLGLPLPQVPGLGLQLPQIPGFPPLVDAPPSPALPGFPHLPPVAGLPNAPPSQPLPSLPTLLPVPPMLGHPSSPGSSPSPPPPAECLTPLLGMMLCLDYLTNITVTTPPSTCCDGLKSVISNAPICLCHGMNGDMSKIAPNPIDPIRMLILPLRCGTMLPIQTFFMCSTRAVPPLMPPSSPELANPPVSPSSEVSP